jgi:hypothetical protein
MDMKVTFQMSLLSPKFTFKWLAMPLHIREVPDPNLGLKPGYPG